MTDLKRLLFILSALLFAVAVSALSPPPADAQGAFPVFDALLYKNKPDLAQYGLSPIRMVYASEIWVGSESRDNPDTARIAEVAGKIASGSLVCVDIEHWPVNGKPAVRKNNIDKFRTVASIIKWNNPSVSLGFYNVLPVSEYWRAIGARGARGYTQWQQENRKLKVIAEFVDAVFPSLYTSPVKTPKTWEQSAIANIQEAKKYNKPVYVFLWPKYTSPDKELSESYLSVDFWRLQLETCRKYADGIVIWGGYQQQWDENAPWWIETKRFMEGLTN